MKRAIYCSLISAVIGFVIAGLVLTPTPSPRFGTSSMVPYFLCPPLLVWIFPSGSPAAESIWLFFGPVNALIYGAVGFTLWLLIVGDDDELERKHEDAPDKSLGI